MVNVISFMLESRTIMLYHYDALLTGLPWTEKSKTFSCVIFNSDFTGQCNKVIFTPFLYFFCAVLDFRDNSHNAFIFSQQSAVNVLDRAYSNGIIYSHESRASSWPWCGLWEVAKEDFTRKVIFLSCHFLVTFKKACKKSFIKSQ